MESLAYTPIREAGNVKLSLIGDQNPEALSYIQNYVNTDYEEVSVLKTSTRFNVETLPKDKISNLVNLRRVNDIRHINKFFETVNAELAEGGLYIGCFENKEQRKERIFKKFPAAVAYPFYVLDFIWKRIFPKMSLTKQLYFALTKGHNRVLSLPEVLGRLVSCGFEIINYSEVEGLTFFTVRKVSPPTFDNNPTYGPLISLNRVGKNGKFIKVFKIRTMHPYAEYLQEFVYKQNNIQNGGKFNNDFRITSWGCFLRKFWLDELPMLYNWIKGDLKLIGVRPLSRHYFRLYPEHFQKRRLSYKPGLIPPFYADLPETMDEICASEKKYMMEYEKQPILTDIKYFFKSIYNIVVKRARSN